MPLILLRHPPCREGQGRCYGRLDLLPDIAYLETQLPTLKDLLPLSFALLSSPARRCQVLAEKLSASQHCTTQIDPLLQEIDFGEWEGLPWSAVPREQLDEWAADIWHYRPGKGESADQVRQRWHRFYQQYLQTTKTSPTIVAVTHAGFIRMALAEQGLIANEDRWTYPIAYLHPYVIT